MGEDPGQAQQEHVGKAENNSWHPSTSRATQGEHVGNMRAKAQAQTRYAHARPQPAPIALGGKGWNLLRACES
jgi:hypothetical protein